MKPIRKGDLMIITDLHNISKEYSLIYADPPWEQTKGNKRKCRPNQGKILDYPTMSVSECIQTQMPFFNNAAEKHNVFMWTIDKFLHETEVEMKQIGYALHARFVWDKTNGIAPAFTVRFTHEYLLWFYKPGKMLMPCRETRGKYTTVLREASTYHSHKPICAYEMLENMFPNVNKIELFAREQRDGWDCWGNELEPIDNLYENAKNAGKVHCRDCDYLNMDSGKPYCCHSRMSTNGLDDWCNHGRKRK